MGAAACPFATLPRGERSAFTGIRAGMVRGSSRRAAELRKTAAAREESMAHLVDSLAWAGQVPWHGLGTKLPENVTGEEMVRVAGLDWQVIPKPLFAGLDETTGYGVSIPGLKALVRVDRPHVTISVVSVSYVIIQYASALT